MDFLRVKNKINERILLNSTGRARKKGMREHGLSTLAVTGMETLSRSRVLALLEEY